MSVETNSHNYTNMNFIFSHCRRKFPFPKRGRGGRGLPAGRQGCGGNPAAPELSGQELFSKWFRAKFYLHLIIVLDLPGIEPGPHPCHGCVLPLNYRPDYV